MKLKTTVPLLLQRLDQGMLDRCGRLRAWGRRFLRRYSRVHIERLEARMFFSFAAVGSETLVDLSAPSPGVTPAIAMDGSGNYVIVWANNGQDGSGWGIFGQRFLANGTASGTEFRVNQTTAGDQTQPAIAMGSSGAFVVTWTSTQGGNNDIYGRNFNASGVATGNEYLLSSPTAGNQQDSTVAIDSLGDVVVAWDGAGTGETQGIFSRTYLLGSLPLIGPQEVNTTIDHSQHSPTIAMDGGGSYVIAWTDGAAGDKIKARRGSALLGLSGSEFLVGTSGAAQESHPSAGIDSSGNFAIAWAQDNGGSAGLDINARRYSAAGTALDATPIAVNTFTDNTQQTPVLSMRSDGSFAVAWQSSNEEHGGQPGIFAQVFNNNGTPSGGEFQVNTSTKHSQEDPAIVWSGSNAAVAWDGQNDANAKGVLAQRFAVSGVANVAPTMVIPSSQSIPEDTPITFSSGNGNVFSVADSDGGAGVEQVQLIATHGTLTLGSAANITLTQGTGAGDASVTFLGTLGNLNMALNGLVFTPASHFVGAAGISLSIDDLGNSGSGGALTTTSSVVITVNAVAHTPSVSAASTNENTRSTSGLVITPNTLDTSLSGFFQLTGITGGSLFQSDGVTPIANGQFITFAQGAAGLTFAPTTNSTASGAFNIQASTSNAISGLGGSVVADTVTVNPVPLLALPASATINEDAALVFSNALGDAIQASDPGNNAGTASVTLNATNGTLTLASAGGVAISSGAASGAGSVTFTGAFANLNAALNGLRFSPSSHFSGAANLAISVTEGANTAAGSVGITVAPVAHTPTITNAKTVVNAQTTSGLVVTPNPIDGAPVGFIKVTAISGGSLFQQDGVTAINSGDFITVAQAAAGLRFTPAPGSLANGSFGIQASTAGNDAGLGGSVVAATIAVAGPPVNQAPGAQSINQDTALVFNSSNPISVSDGSIGAGADSITLSASNGTITVASGSGVTITSGSGTNNPTVSFIGTIAQLRGALSNLVFTPLIHFSGSASLQIVTTDPANVGSGGPLSATSTIAINVIQVAHTPSVTPATTTETAQTISGLVITPNAIDASLSGFFKITAITNGTLFQADGTTSITSGQFITFAQGEAGLTFTPNPGSAIAGGFTVQASATSNNGGLGGSQVAGTIAITRKPALAVESTPRTFIEGSSAEVVSPLLTISQPNGRLLTGATVRLNGYVAGQDSLQFVDQNGITGSWDSVGGVLTLTGSASAAAYQSALESVTYFNPSEDPSQASRSAQFTVTDALFASLSATRTINVVAINNVPTIAAPQSQSTVEDVPLMFSTAAGNGIVVADVDGEGQPEQLTLTASAGTLATATNPGNPAQTLVLTGSITQLNQQLDGLTFTPALHDFHPATITISLDDLGNTGVGGPQTANATIAINIAPVAHTPSVTNASTTEGHRSSGGLVITPNPADQGLAGFFKITSITGGTLVQQNGFTPISEGDFIAFAQGTAGLRFTPTRNSVSDGSFNIRASVSNSDVGLGGAFVQATISVVAAPLQVRNASLDVRNKDTASITASALTVVSPAGAGDAVVYTVLTLPAHGTLLLDGIPLRANDTFTAADVSRGAVQYAPANGDATPDGFQFVATDSAGRTSGASTFHIEHIATPNIPTEPVIPAPPPGSNIVITPEIHGSGYDDRPSGSGSTSGSTSTSADTTTVTPSQTPSSSGGGSDSVVPDHTAAQPAPPANPAANAPADAPKAAAAAAAQPAEMPNPVDPQKIDPLSLTPIELAGIQKTLDQQSRLWVDLDAMKHNMTSELAFKAWAGTASFVSVGMSLAYFMWMFRAGSLISSLLSSMPAWNFVDPLPILESMGSSRGGPDDDEGLESLVNGGKKSA